MTEAIQIEIPSLIILITLMTFGNSGFAKIEHLCELPLLI